MRGRSCARVSSACTCKTSSVSSHFVFCIRLASLVHPSPSLDVILYPLLPPRDASVYVKWLRRATNEPPHPLLPRLPSSLPAPPSHLSPPLSAIPSSPCPLFPATHRHFRFPTGRREEHGQGGIFTAEGWRRGRGAGRAGEAAVRRGGRGGKTGSGLGSWPRVMVNVRVTVTVQGSVRVGVATKGQGWGQASGLGLRSKVKGNVRLGSGLKVMGKVGVRVRVMVAVRGRVKVECQGYGQG